MKMHKLFIAIVLIASCLFVTMGTCLGVSWDGGYDGDVRNGGIYIGYDHATKSDVEAQFRAESLWKSGNFSKQGLSYGVMTMSNNVAFVFFDSYVGSNSGDSYSLDNKNTGKYMLDMLADYYEFKDALEKYHTTRTRDHVPYALTVGYRVYEVGSGKSVYPVSGGNNSMAYHSLYYYADGCCSSADVTSISNKTGNTIWISGLKENVEYCFEFYFVLLDAHQKVQSLTKITGTDGYKFKYNFRVSRDGTEKGALKTFRVGLNSSGRIIDNMSGSTVTSLQEEASDEARQLTGVTFEDTNPLDLISAQREKAIRQVASAAGAEEISQWFILMRMITIALTIFGLMIALIKCALPGYQGPFLLRFKAAVAGWLFVLICIGASGTILSILFSIAFQL